MVLPPHPPPAIADGWISTGLRNVRSTNAGAGDFYLRFLDITKGGARSSGLSGRQGQAPLPVLRLRDAAAGGEIRPAEYFHRETNNDITRKQPFIIR
jgi:hypothetical protein